MRAGRVLDMQIKMHLLRVSVRPLRGHVIGRELDTDHPSTIRVDDAMPHVVGEHPPAEHSGPERALGIEVNCIEHDYPSHDLHALILAVAAHPGQVAAPTRLTYRRGPISQMGDGRIRRTSD